MIGEQNMQQIQFISIEKLQHHPDNPRKNIGDITELTASIKTDGVLQNLTVVPVEDGKEQYYVVIGNRRLEASLAAGLTELPCFISNMDYNKQLETMLIENMNRSDLTPLEEAEGFKQLTLAGYTVDDIADKTGFSKSTVQRRLKIAEYNHDKTAKAIERGGTLDDFVKIEKVKSKSVRQKLINSIGTENFNIELKRALREQTVEENKKIARKALEGIATEISTDEAWSYGKKSKYDSDWSQSSIDLSQPIKLPIKLSGKYNHYFCVSTERIGFYKEKQKVESTKPQKTAKQRNYEKNYKQLNKLASEFYELRSDFIKTLSTMKQVKDWQSICVDALIKSAVINYSTTNIDCGYYYMIGIGLGSKNCKSADEKLNAFLDIYKEHEAGMFIERTYNALSDSKEVKYHTNENAARYSKHYKSAKLDVLYEFLVALGYEMSTEEKQYQNGTHELFMD